MAQQIHSFDSSVRLYVVTVDIFKGIDLPASDLNGSSDAFVITKIFHDEWSTKVVEKNLNPEWNESKRFCFFDPPKLIEFAVRDKDKNSKDDELGRTMFECAERFNELSTKLEKLQSHKLVNEEDQEKENDETPEKLCYEFDGELALQPTKGSIKVRIICEVLLPLNTQSRLKAMNKTLTTLHETISHLQHEKQELTNQINQHDTRLGELDTEIQPLNEKVTELEKQKIHRKKK